MKKLLLIFFSIASARGLAQPSLVNTSAYADVRTIAYDSLTNKIYYNLLFGCQTWFIPCAYNYISAFNNIINKHDYTDNTVSTVQNSSLQIAPPAYPVNNQNSVASRQSRCEGNYIYTNFGYYFNKIDKNTFAPVWSYSPATNPSLKEISTFEIKNDSVFFFQKDSASLKNYYTLFVRNKVGGNAITYNSITASNPTSSLGSVEGYINNSIILGNTITISGAFTASISGVQVARNLAVIDLASGQLAASPLSFAAGTSILDMVVHDNKIHVAGQFTNINGQTRNNYAILDSSLNLLPQTIQFAPFFDPPSTTWLDKIVFYDKYLIAKGNYTKIDNYYFGFNNTYQVQVINTDSTSIMPWTINLPGNPVYKDYTFELRKNKLYIKNRYSSGSPFYIYCLKPLVTATNILYPGSTVASTIPSITVCSPDNGNANIFVAPIRYATGYNWTYSGANATVVPLGNGSSAKLVVNNNSSSGILSVTAGNDCGLSTPAVTLSVIVKPKPVFNLPVSHQTIICNPDSTQLLVSTTNTNTSIWWRKSGTAVAHPQPFFAKTIGNYYMIIADTTNGCKDSGAVLVTSDKILPNAKITSHSYPGVAIPMDTITCYKPLVNIIAASDTGGVTISWKSIATNSVYTNPLSISMQDNLKVLVKRNSNNCVDSSLIVLVGQNTAKPNITVSNSIQTLNCSIYQATLSALFSPSDCISSWKGPLGNNFSNPSNVSDSGKYRVTVTNTVNGCFTKDSLSVLLTNKLLLKSSNDTTACRSTPVSLSSVRIGTLAGVTYSWSNGSSGNSITVNPGSTGNYIVYANGPGACNGVDTVKVIIPLDIRDSVIAYKSCDNSPTGSISMFAKGGIPPYKYSINNGNNFSGVNTFTNLNYGSYYLLIKDSIGCSNSSTVSLDSTSNLPVPEFLASTLNYKRDTIVLVDISIPRADSIKWEFPAQASVIGGDMFNPVVTLSDTGSFLIKMKAFYGQCVIDTAKLIRFGVTDTLHDLSNGRGIKSLSIYPNPNNGLFTVHVEFYVRQNASVQVWDTSPNNYFQQNYYDSDSIFVPIDVRSLQNGNYILRIIGEYDAKNKSFIISK